MSRPAWGNPWRGKVQGGAIALPGGASKITEQPQQLNARHYDELGATYLQRGPLAAVTRSPEELAADAAAGRTWRTDAILSGARMHLYGTRLDGWVYCAADGSRWLVSAAPLTVALQTDQPFTASLTLTRFGDFSGPAAQQSVAVSLADLGQAEPDPAHPAGTEAYCAVCDIRPDGSKALLMIYQPVVPFAQSSGWHPLHKRPMGWVELQLSGGVSGITAVLTVVRTRAQTMGSGTWSNYASGGGVGWEQSDESATVDMGDYLEITYTPRPLTSSVTGTSFSWSLAAGNYSYSFSGRILALWYTAGGDLEEATLDAATSGTVANPPPTEVVAGSMVIHVPKAGGASTTISDTRVHTLSRTCTCSEQFSVTFRRGGVAVDQSSGAADSSIFNERRFIWQTAPEYVSRASQVLLDGVTDSEESSTEVAEIRQYLAAISPRWFNALMPGNSAAQSAFRATDMLLLTPGRQVEIDPVRYSNNLIGLRRYQYDYASGVESWRHGPAARPEGVNGGDEVVAFGAVFGSFNPATQEVVRDQTSAVCWI